MSNWDIFRENDGSSVAKLPAGETPDYEWAGAYTQKLANKLGIGLGFRLDEGASAYRYPRKSGRPATGHAKTGAERIAKLRQERKQQGVCPCCGQKLPANNT